MGMFKMFSSSSADKSYSLVGSSLRSASKFDMKNTVVEKVKKAAAKSMPNPDPLNYKIIKHVQLGYYLVLKIKYLDCTNYEGVKILVFKTTLEKLINQEYIDPHFCDNKKFISPIARFIPTNTGWSNAVKFIASLKK